LLADGPKQPRLQAIYWLVELHDSLKRPLGVFLARGGGITVQGDYAAYRTTARRFARKRYAAFEALRAPADRRGEWRPTEWQTLREFPHTWPQVEPRPRGDQRAAFGTHQPALVLLEQAA